LRYETTSDCDPRKLMGILIATSAGRGSELPDRSRKSNSVVEIDDRVTFKVIADCTELESGLKATAPGL
jgi:hypothetical protein